MSNMQYWDAMKRPPESALKTIKGGRLSGMSDISPQWRYQIMTETYGPIGVGWYYTIDDLWVSEGWGDCVFANAKISMYIKHDGEWSKPIPGIGGSQFVIAERNGMHNNDEAYKMATTDALSVAMKSLGVAADIYAGRYDGSKYIDQAGSEPPQAAEEDPERSAGQLETARQRTIALLAKIDNDMYVEDMTRIVNAIDNLDDMRERYKKIQEWIKEQKELGVF